MTWPRWWHSSQLFWISGSFSCLFSYRVLVAARGKAMCWVPLQSRKHGGLRVLKHGPQVPLCCEWLSEKKTVLVAQSCPTLSDPVNCSPPGSSLHGILQARVLQWAPFPFSGTLSDPGIEPALLHCRQILYHLSHHCMQIAPPAWLAPLSPVKWRDYFELWDPFQF